ncbi:MAG: tetratricopeptide repeat protein [Candidatus Wenzhouxiangella sp. M2_3B_020]
MSLLNDVLRDLERRDAGPEATSPPPTAARRRPPGAGRLLAGALLAAIVVAAVIWFGLRPAQDPPANASQPTVPDASETVDATSAGESVARAAPPSGADDVIAGDAGSNDEATVGAVEESTPEPAEEPTPVAGQAESTRETDGDFAASAEAPQASDPVEASRSSNPEPPATVTEAPAASADEPGRSDAPRISIERVSEPDASPVRRARRALGQGRTDRAAALLRDAVESGTADAEAYRMMARLQADGGRTDAAVATLERARQRFHGDHRFVLQQARILLAAGRAGAAATLLADDPPPPARADHHLVWAAALRRLDRYDEALARYGAVLTADPAHGRAWLGRALTLESLGRPADARPAYLEAERHGDAETARFARWRRSALADAADERETEG